jgi:hypothetical protein
MASRSSDGSDLVFPARGLSLAGLVLGALYLSILAGSLFPIQLLNPAWQLKLGAALINASPFPLIGLGAMHLARVLDPADRLLRSRSRLGARLAVAVALGFLLLIPLLSLAAISEQQQRVSSQASLIVRASANLKALRQVVASASNGQELRERLIGAGGPVLDAQAPARPLPALRAEVSSLLDQAAAQVARQQKLLPSANPLLLLPEILRNGFASLALALGFAGLAQRPGRKLSLLAELQIAWDRWRRRLTPARRKAGRRTGNAAYLHQISNRNPDRG